MATRSKTDRLVKAAPPAHSLHFHGTGGALFGLFLKGALLSVLTLGLYSFWNRAEQRRYIWGHLEFEGDRFQYHGTGRELLNGFSRFFAFFLLPMLVVSTALNLVHLAPVASLFTYAFIFAVIVPMAVVGRHRYRMSRTSWQGIRFSFRGKVGQFLPIYFRATALTALTLGLYRPFAAVTTRRFLTEHTRFGTEAFGYDGQGGELFGKYLKALVLTALTFGIYAPFWLAESERYHWGHTTFKGLRFKSTVTGGSLFILSLTNILLMVCTLGLAFPWVRVRTLRYHLEHRSLDGQLDLAAIKQDADRASAVGDVGADMVDVGFLDMDLAL